MKNLFKKIVFFFLEFYFFKLLLSRLFFLILFFNNYNKIKKKKINILVLSSYRLRDLNHFNKLNQFNFLIIPIRVQYFIFSRFNKFMTKKRKNFFKGKNYASKELDLIDNFFNEIMGYSMKKLNILIVFSGAANYIQDAIFFSFFKKKNIKIVIIQRENIGIQKKQNKIQEKFWSKWEPTLADLVLTYNETTKKFMEGVNFYKNCKIVNVGALRMVDFIKSSKKIIKTKEKLAVKNILFFSFLKYVGISINENLLVFNKKKDKGLKNFFINTHNLLLNYAENNPNIKLIIKHKFGGRYLEEIRSNWKHSTNKPFPKNCLLTDKINPHKLITSSDLVIGFNSITIFEAGLKDIPIIIPAFDEVKTKFKKYYDFSELKKAYNVVDNKNDFIKTIDYKLNNFKISKKEKDLRKIFFSRYVSPINTDVAKNIVRQLKLIIK